VYKAKIGKTCKLALLFILFGSLLLVFPQVTTEAKTTAGPTLIFHDDFNDPVLDFSKWSVTSNVNGGYGGKIIVEKSCLTLSSHGTSYPMVCTAQNPFQNTKEWTLEFDITYNVIGGRGSGFIVSNGSYFPYDHKGLETFLQIWNYQFQSVDFNFMILDHSKFSDSRKYAATTQPCDQTFLVKLVSEKGTYKLFVNDILVGSQKADVQPDRIIIGHPEAGIIPFSSESQWCSLSIDSISIYDNTPKNSNSNLIFEPTDDNQAGFNLTVYGIIIATAILVTTSLLLLSIKKKNTEN
jgi:hypothetical protein